MEVYRFNSEIYRVDDCVDSANVLFFFLIGLVTGEGLYCAFEWNWWRKIEIVFLRQQM